MQRFFRAATSLEFAREFLVSFVLLAALPLAAQTVATIRRVDVLNRGNNFELEIEASQPVTPQTQVVTGPDRLVIDFPNALPGRALRPIPVNNAAVKGVRMGLFESNPPVARVVLDLKSPQRYEVFPSGKTVIVKLGSGAAASPAAAAGLPAPAIVALNSPVAAPAPAAAPKPRLQVEFSGGRLRIHSEKATLAEILSEVQRRTGANVTIPAGAEQQQVVTDLGPGPAREVLSSLLSGSAYNVVLIGSPKDVASVTSIILTPREPGSESMPATYSPPPSASQNAAEAQPEAAPPPPPPDNPPPDQPSDQVPSQENVPPPQ